MEAPLHTRTEPILLPYFPRLFYLALHDQGFEEEQIFEGMDFDSDHLHQESYRLTIEQHEKFILRMLDLTNDPHFALRLIDVRDTSATILTMLAAANSGSIASALHIIARYSKLITRVFDVHMQDDARPPRMDITLRVEHDHVAYFAISSLALFLNRFFQDVLNGRNLVRSVELPLDAPDGFNAVRTQFPFEVLFNQSRSCVCLCEQYLQSPLRQSDPQTMRLLTEMAEQQLREAEAETSLVGAVKALLIDRLAVPPKLDDIARVLNLSARSLRRKLAESGTTYQGILDDVRLASAKRLISEKYGANVTPIVADSSKEEGRQALFEACPDPDILAITIKPPAPNGDFLKVTPEMWRDSVETALIGPIEIMRNYIPGMKERGFGRIVNIATISAKNPMIWRLMSGPARSALINYTASVSREIAQYGVNINNILPGMFATEGASELLLTYAEAFGLEPNEEVAMNHFIENNRIPAGYVAEAADMAPMAALLCSPLSRFIVGQNIVIDGGQHHSLF